MKLKLKLDTKKLREALTDIKSEASQSAVKGMRRGMRLFESHIIKTQMSGRVNEEFGLKRQTGTLAKSWFIVEQASSNDHVLTLGTRTKYAEYHQKIEKGQAPNIPKRLYIPETFQTHGRELILDAISKNLSQVQRIKKLGNKS